MASSSAIQPREKYDVFISFRGTDTRWTFTSHLHAALIRMKIDAYIDYRLERGDDIGSALLKAIEGSKIFVIIFSQDYASSTWCLDELVHIMDCKERYKRIVIPIFYNIDPAVVRHQTESYAEAFAKHRSRIIFREEKLVEWKGALKTAASLSGFHSTSSAVRDDSDLVEQVGKDILTKLNRESSSDLKGLVGVESRIQQILLLLYIVPDDVCVRYVGIWGMGGIGKTTLANAVFHGLSSQFEACCFLPNVRETSAAKGDISPQLYNLRDILLSKLLGEGTVTNQTTPTIACFVKERLQRIKVLVVLDDVDDWCQLEFLVGDQVSFGSGSRIIITTRDMRQLREMEVLRKGADHDVKIYQVEELNGYEASQLFHLNAPRDICSEADSKQFLIKVIRYAEGNPLALKIWRSLFFRCKGKEDLEDLWNKLKKFPHKDLQNVCRISYEALEENEREIFLDMVCFHKGNKIGVVKRELDACGLFSNIGIEILIDMTLISIKDECVWIHDVIQEFGWDIIRKECPEEAGKRTRLYTSEDIIHVFEKATGTATVKSICLNTWEIKEIKLAHPQVFTGMYNLIFLKFYGGKDVDISLKDGKMEHFLDHESFPDSLRYLHWEKYPLKSLPSQFSPNNLVELHMPFSKLQRLWTDGQNPENLKRISLHYSLELVEIPDLSESKNIESIDLNGCENLVQVPSSIWSLNKLVELKLGGCWQIKNYPRSSWKLESLTSLNLWGTKIVNMPTSICKMKFLEQLDLSHCLRLDYFPEILEPMEHLEVLRLSNTQIKQLPESIGNLVGLKLLDLSECRSLESVPQSIYKLNLLEELSLGGCWKLKKFPSSSILGDCRNLEEIPDDVFSLTSLKRLNLRGSLIESIPPLVQFSELTYLNISNCERLQSLPQVPCLLETLDANGCTTLKTVSFSMTAITQGSDQIDISCQPMEGRRKEKHAFFNCLDLDENARSNIMNDAQLRIMRNATVASKRKDIYLELFERDELSVRVICPGNEIPKWFSYQTEGSSIYINLPPHSSDENFLGFALCAVVGISNSHTRIYLDLTLKCRYNFKFNHGICRVSDVTCEWLGMGDNFNFKCAGAPDHVYMWYHDYHPYERFDDTNWATEASFEFCAKDRGKVFNVKRCGVCLLYAQRQDAVHGSEN
ncbi:hypothetical protein M0R45_005893 [Rubus argutus]|uniref:ADP-ribosyl cyclase/cyclic ADP-ribose hydrolase n=1 Tax=Rubus argutus TaxID=59490 RepID=A0AAW1YNX9_RUBAR